MTDYSKFLIRQYSHWGVYIHENQCYLGRCVIWCDREDALDLTDASPDEVSELHEIIKQLKAASFKAFRGDWFNYAFLGNITAHLHGHFIPRYKSDRVFEGMTFSDERWGQNYLTNYDFKTPPNVLEAIQHRMTELL